MTISEQPPDPADSVPSSPPRPRMTFWEWLGGGAVLSSFSPTFYRLAARQSLIWAVIFFVLFGTVISVLQSVSLYRMMRSVTSEIRDLYTEEQVPAVTITNGVAEVEGPEPAVLLDEQRMLIVFDTTGAYTGIDRSRYDQGILLTRTSFIVLNQDGRYQETPLIQVQQMVGQDPLILDQETVPQYWTTLSTWFGIGAFVGLVIWHVFIRVAFVVLVGLALWGLARLFGSTTELGPVLIVGIYALVPTLYLRFLMSLVPISFIGLTTIIYLILWGVFLIITLSSPRAVEVPAGKEAYFLPQYPVRAWRALIGLPLLVDFVVQMLSVPHHNPYITWGLAVLTFVVLLLVSRLPALQPEPPASSGPSADVPAA